MSVFTQTNRYTRNEHTDSGSADLMSFSLLTINSSSSLSVSFSILVFFLSKVHFFFFFFFVVLYSEMDLNPLPWLPLPISNV